MKQHFPPMVEFKFTVLPSDKRSLSVIESLVKEVQPLVVIIDPLTNLLRREDKKEDVEHLLKELDSLIERYAVSIILIHHERKGGQGKTGETLDSMRGSSALTGWADTICRISRIDKRKDKIKLDFECRHAAEEVEPIKLNFRREHCQFEEDVTLVAEVQQSIRQELQKSGGQLPLAETKERLEDKASSRTIERAIKEMPEIQVELDPSDKRKRILKLNLQGTISTRHLQG